MENTNNNETKTVDWSNYKNLSYTARESVSFGGGNSDRQSSAVEPKVDTKGEFGFKEN